VIFNNGQYQANRAAQNAYKWRIFETRKYVGVSLNHPDIDYVKMAGVFSIEAESVSDPSKITAALSRCKHAMQKGGPYLVDVRIEKHYVVKDSSWYDFYSVASMQAGQS